jgi:ribonuclease HI
LRISFKISLYIVLISSILISCGHRKNPTGGKRDTIQPEIVAISPDEFSDLTDQDIEVVFSKPIERSTILSGILIYPPIQKKKFKWDKNVLIIKIMEKLDQDTNYFVTFTTRIKGEHGNELLQEYTFTYASGKLSENRISGRTIFEDPLDDKLPIKSTLMATDSTFIFNREITTSTFALDDLNNIDHIIEAYCDKNKNDKYDYGNEPYCYMHIPAAKFSSIKLEMTYSDTLKPELKSANSIWNNQIEIIFNESITELQEVSISSTDSLPKPLNIITSLLKDDRLLILTEPMDTLKYEAKIQGLMDKKKNTADTLSIIMDSNTMVDSIAPQVTSIIPRNGGTVDEYKPIITISLTEIVLENDFTAKLIEAETSKEIPLRMISGHSDIFELEPIHKLTNYTTYNISIDVKDLNGNKLPTTFTASFIAIIR